MKHVLDENNAPRFKQLAVRVFGVSTTGKSDQEIAYEGIDKLRVFWNSIGAPATLADYAIDESTVELMGEKTVSASPEYGNFKRLNKQDSIAIFTASLTE